MVAVPIHTFHLVLAVAAGSASPRAATAPLPDSVVHRIDSAISVFMAARKVPGLSVAIGLDQQLVWTQGYGLGSLESFVPVTAASLFRTGSVGKPMTAAAVLRLWQEGRLDLDTPIQRYCPAFPAKRWPVTARHLLTHTSGIRDKTAAEETNYRHYPTIAAAVGIFGNDSLTFQPGTDYRYTSYGYDVLGCAIEGASGQSYMDYMQAVVFGPARMAATRLDVRVDLVPGRVSGYALDSAGRLANSVHDDMSNRIPAGGFISTAADLVRFGMAVSGGKLVSDASWRAMTTLMNRPNAPPGPEGYALGWAIGDWYGVKEVWHGGGTPQTSTFLYLLPSKGLVVAFMTNLEAVPDRGDLAGDLAKIVLGPNAPHKPAP